MRTVDEILADDRLWTVPDVAKYTGMSKSWVYQAAENGTLPAIRLGNRLRFRAEAVRAVITGSQPMAPVLTLRPA